MPRKGCLLSGSVPFSWEIDRLEIFLFHHFTSGVTVVALPQVYDVREERGVKDGLQALRKRQRIDIEMGGGRHEVKVGGCRRQRLGGAGSCLIESSWMWHTDSTRQFVRSDLFLDGSVGVVRSRVLLLHCRHCCC